MNTAPDLTPDDLREALRDDQLFLHYQPQVASDDSIASVEALARWRHPEYGLIPTDRFAVLAEKSGLIGDLGAWVMRRACQEGAGWPRITVGVNVSPLQFRQPDFVDFVSETATAAASRSAVWKSRSPKAPISTIPTRRRTKSSACARSACACAG